MGKDVAKLVAVSRFAFDLLAVDGSGARLGRLRTRHGVVETPVFMPVGTQASVKSLAPDDLVGVGAGLILANTYHLHLRPGADAIARLGGLHRFMSWPGALLTDSGGFQVMSLGALRRVDDDGVTFRSHLDGSVHRFTPESATGAQELLGADVIMAFDQCPALPASRDEVKRATERTHRWADRCLAAHGRDDQGLFGIVQGGTEPDLRRLSARYIAGRPFAGIAIGGLSVGEPKEITYATVALTTAALPVDRPRYLMGVGAPEDLLTGIGLGIDMFDCVLPSRIARHGALYRPDGRLSLRAAGARQLDRPVDETCDCVTCRGFSIAYLAHLFRAGELLVHRLATLHNLRFLARLVADARAAIRAGAFTDFRDEFLARYRPASEERRLADRERHPRRRRQAAPPGAAGI